MTRDCDVVVVGAGIGGLATAMRLAAAGERVLVLERGDQVGGKMRTVSVAGREIDSGPTVLTMKYVFEQLFSDCGRRLSDYVELSPLDLIARHAWPDGSRLDLFHSEAQTVEAIRDFAGSREADGYCRFARHAATIHSRVQPTFMDSPKTPMLQIVKQAGFAGALGLLGVDWHRNMWRALGDFFDDPRLRQLFGRYATYYGSSPFSAPATLSVIAHVELQGVWRVVGGMQALAEGMANAVRAMGGEIVLGAEVSGLAIERDRVRGVRLRGGGASRCRAVVLNADPAAVATGRFGDAAAAAVDVPRAEASLSAITFGWVARPRGVDLAYHTVFFSSDYAREFHSIFKDHEVPADPTVYVCAQDRGGEAPPAGPERLFALINAPATGTRRDFRIELPRWRESTLSALRRGGLEIGDVEGELVTTPTDFASMFPATGGALYGPATHSAMGAFARPGPRTRVEGLYLVGGGIHPGAGVPMVATGARFTAEAVRSDGAHGAHVA